MAHAGKLKYVRKQFPHLRRNAADAGEEGGAKNENLGRPVGHERIRGRSDDSQRFR